MPLMTRAARCGATLLLGLAAGGVLAADPDATVSFRKDLQPILNARCVVCHVTGAENGELNLARSVALRNLVSVPSAQAPLPRVMPGKPAQSYLMHKLLDTQASVGGSGGRMPLTDTASSPMDPAQIEQFRAWIEQGAADN